ncbi:glycoside hydrolase family 3 C-terminal domain-containing protein [Streptomyces aquilus]|uniref:glycoside hydrolase family 3 protein n=1 Tax=Streptomyces aquilus TaxID=2548456 RepID=UPI0037D20AA5
MALIGPCADDGNAFFGCYSFPNRVLPHHPGHGNGIEAHTLLDALATGLSGTLIAYEQGCPVKDVDRSSIDAAVAAARQADVCIAMVGERAALFGLGTSGEGCDVKDLSLPGVQGDLVEALLATSTPVVLLVVSGRPYALGARTDRAAAVIQACFPGEEGGPALAGVLSGRINPSAKLRCRSRGPQAASPARICTPRSAATPRAPAASTPRPPPSGTGCRAADPVAQLPCPMIQLTAFTRAHLAPAEERRVTCRQHADRPGPPGRTHSRTAHTSSLAQGTLPCSQPPPSGPASTERADCVGSTVFPAPKNRPP